MRKYIADIREAVRHLDSGLLTETQFVDKVAYAISNIDYEGEYQQVKEEEQRAGIITLALMFIGNHMRHSSKAEVAQAKKEIEASINKLHELGYRCWADKGMQFHAEKDNDKFTHYDPRVFVEAASARL